MSAQELTPAILGKTVSDGRRQARLMNYTTSEIFIRHEDNSTEWTRPEAWSIAMVQPKVPVLACQQ